MARKRIQIVKILIASPSDVAEERNIVSDEIGKWNRINRDVHRIGLDAVRWETHAYSASGDRPQELLNLQIVDECEFAIAMFHARIGTDTGFAPGGAVEEVRRMMEQNKHVMCYFSEMSLPIEVDVAQLVAVREFSTEIRQKALCDFYKDLNDFRQKVAFQLAIYLSKRYGFAPFTGMVGQPSNEAYTMLVSYQDYLRQDFGTMNLSGSPAIASFSVSLSDTFVSLRLSDTWRSEARFQCELFSKEIIAGPIVRSPEEVMTLVFKNHRLLLVIGDPGLGKTTLLQYYALSILEGKYDAFGFKSPIPVFWLPLRELKRSDDGYGSLSENLAEWCGRNFLENIASEHCSEWLEVSRSLVLLDGLDEISDVDDRIEMCRWIDGMVKRYGNTFFVVSSRSTGYRKGDGIEIETPHVRADIMDFSNEQQSEFLQKWFRAAYLRELPPNGEDSKSWRETQERKADEKSAAIIVYLAEESNNSMKTLAAVPLLLQIMALLWKDHEYLPDSRMKLYDAALNYLLDYRDRKKKMKPLLSAEDARRVLGPVSLWMHEEVKRDEVKREVMHSKMDEMLCTLSKQVSAKTFCQNLVNRAGVLVEYGDADYHFRHKTFREYLAAVQLEKNIHREGFLDGLIAHFGDDWWQEVFRFFIAQLDDADMFQRFMVKLFESPVTESLTPKQQELLKILVQEAPQKKYSSLIEKLLNPNTTANRQRYIGECLKAIGKADVIDAILQFEKKSSSEIFVSQIEHDAHYIPIKGGTFTYSVTKRRVVIPGFWLARYPVTNRQYRRFLFYLQTGDLEEIDLMPLKYFKQALVEFVINNGLTEFQEMLHGYGDFTAKFRSGYDDDKRFNGDEQPVVGINWYAARSYCLWLSLMETNGENYNQYCLPKEVEWEYAAGGKERRAYPWGLIDPSPKRVNYNRNEGSTTPVGSYPEGATPDGLYDMAGNVWEWMENYYNPKTNKNARALRGGSWNENAGDLRCNVRDHVYPKYWYHYVGFRVLRTGFVMES